MSRRVSLPGADELFRATSSTTATATTATAAPAEPAGWQSPPAAAPSPVYAVPSPPQEQPADPGASEPASASPVRQTRVRRSAGERRPTGRERHEEKITVYVSPEELVDLERARLTLRAEHGLAIDRGRIVREALAVVLADLDAKGDASILVRRLTGR